MEFRGDRPVDHASRASRNACARYRRHPSAHRWGARSPWAPSDPRLAGVCESSRVAGAVIVKVPEARLDELEPLWRALHDHHHEVSPHLRDRERPYERSWESRRQSERALLQSERGSFVLAALKDDRYVGYAFVRIRLGAAFAASWTISDPTRSSTHSRCCLGVVDSSSDPR